jgi:hypothetical protein
MAVPAAGVNVGGAQSANNRWIASAFVMRLQFPPRAVEGQLRVVANGLFLGKPKTRANLGMPTGIFRCPLSLNAARTRRGHVLTDLQGQPLSAGLPGGTGEFTIGVRGVIAANSWAPGPLKSTTVFTTNYLSG